MTQTIDILEKLNKFGKKHGIVLLSEVSTGMRPCVGFSKTKTSRGFIAQNPYNMTTLDVVDGFEDKRLKAPGHLNAYHEHPSLVILVDDDVDVKDALEELGEWVDHLESQGELEVVEYRTGANAAQAMLSGSTGWAIRYKDPA